VARTVLLRRGGTFRTGDVTSAGPGRWGGATRTRTTSLGVHFGLSCRAERAANRSEGEPHALTRPEDVIRPDPESLEPPAPPVSDPHGPPVLRSREGVSDLSKNCYRGGRGGSRRFEGSTAMGTEIIRAVTVSWLVLPFLAFVSSAAPPRTAESLYQRLSPSVVTIKVLSRDGTPISQGSGVIISKDGEILTNYHVVAGGVFFDVQLSTSHSEEPISARPSRCAPELDLASLRVASPPNGFRPARVSEAIPTVGTRVFAIGSPLALEGTFTDGIVSQVRAEQGASLIQTTAVIAPGSSGGGLFSEDGALIGITAMTTRGTQGLNFAVALKGIRPSLVPCRAFPALAADTAPEPTPPPPTPTPRCKADLRIVKGNLTDGKVVADENFRASVYMTATGLVENQGCTPARFVKVRVTMSLRGAFLDTAEAYTNDETIAPGRQSAFRIRFKIPDYIANGKSYLQDVPAIEYNMGVADYLE